MKLFWSLFGLGCGIALAIVIGQRMSTDAMAVVIGVAAGVLASIPTSFLIVAMLRRERRHDEAFAMAARMPADYPAPQPPASPVVILNLDDLRKHLPQQTGLAGGGSFQVLAPPDDYWQDGAGTASGPKLAM